VTVHATAASSGRTPRTRSTPLPGRPRELLDEARQGLARRQLTWAETCARGVVKSGTRRQAADAMIIIADCAQIRGHIARAIALLHRIAEWYPELRAGEAALYGAAALEAETPGRIAAATLKRYAARYPRGRFIRNVRARIRALGDVAVSS
jgi:hypothetical protein